VHWPFPLQRPERPFSRQTEPPRFFLAASQKTLPAVLREHLLFWVQGPLRGPQRLPTSTKAQPGAQQVVPLKLGAVSHCSLPFLMPSPQRVEGVGVPELVRLKVPEPELEPDCEAEPDPEPELVHELEPEPEPEPEMVAEALFVCVGAIDEVMLAVAAKAMAAKLRRRRRTTAVLIIFGIRKGGKKLKVGGAGGFLSR